MKTGIKGKLEDIVTEYNTAKGIGGVLGNCSGSLDVYSTPAMILLMEATAAGSIELLLEEGFASVGTKLEVEHLSATPIGMKIFCQSELTVIDGKRLVFKVEVFDECGLIGKGIHERFIINSERFMKKAEDKKQSIK